MKGFHSNIEHDTLANNFFRKVLYTSSRSQLVIMTLQPNEEIGLETHPNNDQFIRVEKGQGKCLIDDNEYPLEDGVAVIVPAGARHNVINTSTTETLHLYTIYSPAHHKEGTIHETKAIADSSEEDYDGQNTES